MRSKCVFCSESYCIEIPNIRTNLSVETAKIFNLHNRKRYKLQYLLISSGDYVLMLMKLSWVKLPIDLCLLIFQSKRNEMPSNAWRRTKDRHILSFPLKIPRIICNANGDTCHIQGCLQPCKILSNHNSKWCRRRNKKERLKRLWGAELQNEKRCALWQNRVKMFRNLIK